MINKVKRFLHYLYISIKRPEMEILPGNLAFFFMMMIIPVLTILGAFVTNIDIGERTVYDTLMNNLPDNIANLINKSKYVLVHCLTHFLKEPSGSPIYDKIGIGETNCK